MSIALTRLYEATKNYLDNERKIILDKTIDILKEKSDDKKNKLGIDYLTESIEVATITSKEIGLGLSAVLSVLLFRLYSKNKIDKDFIKQNIPGKFSNQIIEILDGLIDANKLDSERIFGLKEVNFNEKYDKLSKRGKKFAKNEQTYLTEQGEYFKNFYVTIGQDIRVVLLKLAYHLFKVKNITNYNEQEKIIITSREARFLYAPMAHQLGLYNIKTFLEEMAMKYLNTEIYRDIAKKLAETKASRDKYIEDFIKPIKKSIEELGYSTNIKGRPKSIHSIWNKIKKQGVGLEKIYDLFAIRLILTDNFKNQEEEKSACWNVYSKITNIWTPNPNRLRDWVSSPKASGYESLHTTVIGPDGKWVEVQIRTQRMDEVAEKGSAAHWRYKEVKGQSGHSNWLDSIRDILENPSSDETESIAKSELYSDTIFVFTPKGEAKKFNNGATVLDFAYKIHSRIGGQCTGAKIKGKLVGIRHKLNNGDIVEILTSNTQTPKFEWLDIVVSTQARTRIKRALKEFEKEKINTGKQILTEAFEKTKHKYNKSDFELDDKKVNILRRKFGISKIDAFYIKLSNEEIKIDSKYLHELFIKPEELDYESAIEKLKSTVEEEQTKSKKSVDYLILDKDMSGIKYDFAKCCNPIPGDNVFAFITATKGTKIHKNNCPNAPDMFKKYPYRVMKATWKQNEVDSKFKAKLKIISEQKPGIVAQISSIIIKQQFVDLYGINIEESNKPTFEGTIGILVNGTKYVNELITKLKAIPGIMNVVRIDKI